MSTIWKATVVGTALLTGGAAQAQDFYEGKTLTYIVATEPGGGYDTYARLIGKYLEKHLGAKVLIKNVPGAGHIVGTNTLWAAEPDGLTIGAFNGNQILGQLVGADGINFDARQMEWMGAPGYNHDLCVLSQKMGVANGEQWLALKTPLKLGGSAPGTPTDDGPKILKEAIGLPMRLISGWMMLSVNRVTSPVNAVPMTTATDRSTMLPRARNSLNPFNMVSRSLPAGVLADRHATLVRWCSVDG